MRHAVFTSGETMRGRVGAPIAQELGAEAGLAAAMVGYAVEHLMDADSSHYIYGMETRGMPRGGRAVQRLNAVLEADGEPPVNVVASAHAAELRWLNGCNRCRFPLELCAGIIGVTPLEIREMVARRVGWLYVGSDGLLHRRADA